MPLRRSCRGVTRDDSTCHSLEGCWWADDECVGLDDYMTDTQRDQVEKRLSLQDRLELLKTEPRFHESVVWFMEHMGPHAFSEHVRRLRDEARLMGDYGRAVIYDHLLLQVTRVPSTQDMTAYLPDEILQHIASLLHRPCEYSADRRWHECAVVPTTRRQRDEDRWTAYRLGIRPVFRISTPALLDEMFTCMDPITNTPQLVARNDEDLIIISARRQHPIRNMSLPLSNCILIGLFLETNQAVVVNATDFTAINLESEEITPLLSLVEHRVADVLPGIYSRYCVVGNDVFFIDNRYRGPGNGTITLFRLQQNGERKFENIFAIEEAHRFGSLALYGTTDAIYMYKCNTTTAQTTIRKFDAARMGDPTHTVVLDLYVHWFSVGRSGNIYISDLYRSVLLNASLEDIGTFETLVNVTDNVVQGKPWTFANEPFVVNDHSRRQVVTLLQTRDSQTQYWYKLAPDGTVFVIMTSTRRDEWSVCVFR